jgi:uncharacterized LabA/DUF88 family protein
VLLTLTLSAIVWLALPVDWQQQAQNGVASAARWVGSLDTTTLLVALISLCVVEALVLLFVPSYRKHGYLTAAPTLIPPVSVYVDAENQLSEATIRSFRDFLTKYLDGRHADLLYFMDASHTAPSAKYKALYRSGFRPIDVPHNPTGFGVIGEAVDREIAMHAFERALLGPAGQEFIIVSGDGDYVPLIYRLVALGHRVQIWALRPAPPYNVVAHYLGVNVIDLAAILKESSSDTSDKAHNEVATSSQLASKRKRKTKRKSSYQLIFVPPARQTIPASGEGKLYYAIVETLDAYQWSLDSSKSELERSALFHSALGNVLRPRLSGVGYGIRSGTDFWLEHLVALRVFTLTPGQVLPKRGETSAEDAAHMMFVAAQRSARAVLAVAASRSSEIIAMSDVAVMIVSLSSTEHQAENALLDLMRSTRGTKLWAHTRYFVRSARALGLLMFEDVPGKPDQFSHPELPAIAPDAERVSDDTRVGDEDDETSPTSDGPPTTE